MKRFSFVVAVTCLFFVGNVSAQPPQPIALNNMAPIYYSNANWQSGLVYADLGNVLWCPVQNGSNGKHTLHCVQPIENLEINQTFPVTITVCQWTICDHNGRHDQLLLGLCHEY